MRRVQETAHREVDLTSSYCEGSKLGLNLPLRLRSYKLDIFLLCIYSCGNDQGLRQRSTSESSYANGAAEVSELPP